MATNKQPLKPGEISPASAQYGLVGPRGGDTGKEVTVPKGWPLPPTPRPGMGFVINDRTRNDSGRGK